jgi:putative membrane protein
VYGAAVRTITNILVGGVAALHAYILVLEMFLWTTPRGMKAFGTDPEFARASAPLAANQGLYNGFLAAGLVWSLVAGGTVGFQAKVFFLSCVVVAGVYGAATANRRILFIQALPGAVTLALVLLTR